MAKSKIYIDACGFIEMAAHLVGTHKKDREDDVAYLKELLTLALKGEIDIYTSTLSIAECQCAYTVGADQRILNDDIKKLFKSILTSGQFVILVQDSVLIAERARNLYWVHQLTFKGADAIHMASALEMRCEEFLTFDEHFHKKKSEVEALGVDVKFPRNTTSLTKELIAKAAAMNNQKDQLLLKPTVEDAPKAEAGNSDESVAEDIKRDITLNEGDSSVIVVSDDMESPALQDEKAQEPVVQLDELTTESKAPVSDEPTGDAKGGL